MLYLTIALFMICGTIANQVIQYLRNQLEQERNRSLVLSFQLDAFRDLPDFIDRQTRGSREYNVYRRHHDGV